MPFINTKTNLALTQDQKTAVKRRFGEAVGCLGKSEAFLMVGFEPEVDLYFKGDNTQPLAFVEVKLFGDAQPSAYDRMTAATCTILQEELGISPANIYVQYAPCDHWGWNGRNF